jgi:hypothetical protein
MEVHHAYRKIDRTSFSGAQREGSPCDGIHIHQPAFAGIGVDASSVVTLSKVNMTHPEINFQGESLYLRKKEGGDHGFSPRIF